jgi:predicted DsbA family dithiol-disulfide isomerase
MTSPLGPSPPPTGTIVVLSDLGCPWAHVGVARLRRARAEAGLDGRLAIDHRRSCSSI